MQQLDKLIKLHTKRYKNCLSTKLIWPITFDPVFVSHSSALASVACDTALACSSISTPLTLIISVSAGSHFANSRSAALIPPPTAICPGPSAALYIIEMIPAYALRSNANLSLTFCFHCDKVFFGLHQLLYRKFLRAFFLPLKHCISSILFLPTIRRSLASCQQHAAFFAAPVLIYSIFLYRVSILFILWTLSFSLSISLLMHCACIPSLQAFFPPVNIRKFRYGFFPRFLCAVLLLLILFTYQCWMNRWEWKAKQWSPINVSTHAHSSAVDGILEGIPCGSPGFMCRQRLYNSRILHVLN